MSRVCPKCGKDIASDNAHFCPECGFSIDRKSKVTNVLKSSEDDWIKNLLWIHDEKTGQKRISKAKLVGIVIFALYIFRAILTSGEYVRMGFIPFALVMLVSLIAGVIYYCLCRGIGFVVRMAMG